ncbi:MAG TPA: type II toxin-antitoxin system Y4mF family antitoxin [Chthonomonadaceae bacterium]|nr:type II toxin-antitoxin system Y4mF family antitoxin [Chthonomonadaceae bacterium]
MQTTSADIGHLVRKTRASLGLTQETLAMAAGTGLRFIIDLERGKPTCQLQKALTVLSTLGIQVALRPPAIQGTMKARGG